MTPARKVVRIRRTAQAERLLDVNEVDDMLDVFAMDDAEVVRVDVNVSEKLAKPEKVPQSGIMRKVEVPVEELTDGISEGWEDDDMP